MYQYDLSSYKLKLVELLIVDLTASSREFRKKLYSTVANVGDKVAIQRAEASDGRT